MFCKNGDRVYPLAGLVANPWNSRVGRLGLSASVALKEYNVTSVRTYLQAKHEMEVQVG